MQPYTFTRAFKFTSFLALMLFTALLTGTLYAAPKVGPITPENSVIGENANDQIGSGGVHSLPNGNIVIASPSWNNGRGAVTCLTPEEYRTGGNVVSASNSLVGTNANDLVGYSGITILTNGNYVVSSPDWKNGAVANAGAATWVNGITCIPHGETTRNASVSAVNSIIGSKQNDRVGNEIVPLTNGNYVVSSAGWGNGTSPGVGAATWGNGNSGTAGIVDVTNSLVGSNTSDWVGNRIVALANGNYIVSSTSWNNGAAIDAGAVTWGDGTTGTKGVVSDANSLVGSSNNDNVGQHITELANGNYVISSPNWRNGAAAKAGAVTWANGSTGVKGVVSAANSLVGSSTNDQVGLDYDENVLGVVALTNGNYVVRSPQWDNGTTANVGAATWGNGLTGIVGEVSPTNSLIGSTAEDYVGLYITALTNGHYVVGSAGWDDGLTEDVGAVTWADGTTGMVGVVSAANSLIGSTAVDSVGYAITALTNGNYVVSSQYWDHNAVSDAGAVTWGSGTGGIIGVVNPANSLVGSTAYDSIGYVKPLTNGNYVVNSEHWDNGAIVDAGSATWGNGEGGTVGVITATNSLVGQTNGDAVGVEIVALSNGNYAVVSPFWSNGGIIRVGAVTWANGTGGTVGSVDATNSLIGQTTYDMIGDHQQVYFDKSVIELNNGNYLVYSYSWQNFIGGDLNFGAVTWINGSTPQVGVVDASNSLVATTTTGSLNGVTVLSNGHYLAHFPYWSSGEYTEAGAITWMNGTGGIVEEVNAANSLVGSHDYERLGAYFTEGIVTALPDGSFMVSAPSWSNGVAIVGAVIWSDGTLAAPNSAPILADIGSKTVDVGATLTFDANATDSDDPAQVLTFIITGAPEDATFDTSTGGFSWTPDESDAGQTFNVTVTVTDDGEPALSDSEAFTITVNPVVVEETNYLANPGFENAGTTNKTAAGWNGVGLTKNDKRVCDTATKTYAHDGECAFRFQFNGASKPARTLQRNLNAKKFAKNETLELRGMVKANGLTAGAKFVLKVVYNNGKTQAVNVKLTPGNYEYSLFVTPQITLKRPAKKITAQIRAGSAKGTFFVDDMAVVKVAAPLTIEGGTPASGLRGLD